MKRYEKPIMEVIKLDLIHTITSSPESTPLVPEPEDPEISGGGWG